MRTVLPLCCGPTPHRNFRFLFASLGRRKRQLGVALSWGSRSWQDRAPCSVHVLLPFFQVSFANIIWSHWEVACVLDRIYGTPRPCQAHRWEVREELAECLAGGWPLQPDPVCAEHLCMEISKKRWCVDRGTVPENLETCFFFLGLLGTCIFFLGLLGTCIFFLTHWLTQVWVSGSIWSLRIG